MKRTSAPEKLAASVINAGLAFILSAPFYLLWGFGFAWKLSAIVSFFVIEFLFFLLGDDRDFGMRIVGSRWKGKYSIPRHLIYNFLYTLSFATLFFHVWFPFDVFFFNLLCLQLPTVLITGTTLHGYLSGLETVK